MSISPNSEWSHPIRSSSDTRGLRKLDDQVLVNIRGLETPGMKLSSFSSMLSDILLRALPHDIALRYHRTCAAEKSTLQAGAPEKVTTKLYRAGEPQKERLQESGRTRHQA
ncbi:hypothetical protein HPB48_011533 [Haemaphysalis longicornis]|uniref:Uncharacterized protein n=1 Tax=Haemaphysalis longicornis TaxID=44386 RepID=A0A9J6GUE6_HAELO|nr:hypothetical protein HPB48_011533 [Haemaphysalis longicornis]